MESIELELRKLTYIDIEHLEGRNVKLMPFWDGTDWHLRVPEAKVVDTTEGDYVAKAATKQSDLFITFCSPYVAAC
jgi:hypothetical protein